MTGAGPDLAAFDFDGTLTTGDTLLGFCWHAAGLRGRVLGCLCTGLLLLAYALRVLDNHWTKVGLAWAWLRGVDEQHAREPGACGSTVTAAVIARYWSSPTTAFGGALAELSMSSNLASRARVIKTAWVVHRRRPWPRLRTLERYPPPKPRIVHRSRV